MGALRFIQDDATDADDWFLVLQADRPTLEGAPEWMMSPDRADAADAMTGGASDVPVVDEAMADPAAPAPGTLADPEAAETLTEAPLTEDGMALPEGYAAIEPATLTAEMLTGADVRDSTDAAIAEVSDLVLTTEGQVTHVVLDVGGFLGIGAKSVALPLDRLTVAQNDDAVRLWVNMTKEELQALPDHQM
jgi:hypothetical protein